MKVCKGCKVELVIYAFYYNKTKKRFFSECKMCNKNRSSKWNAANAAKYLENGKKHRIANPELYREYKKKEYYKNKEKYSISGKLYRSTKHGKAIRLALGRERELRKTKATPVWLTKEQRKEMQLFYINRPEGYHVDHIEPLQGKISCGLHVPWNLQYLLAADNIRKRNKL